MAKTEEDDAATALLQQLQPVAMQDDVRLAGIALRHFHVLPTELRADAGAERLGYGLLRGEARGQEWRRCLVGEAVGDFVRVQNALQEPLAELLMRSLDAGHFDNVDANA